MARDRAAGERMIRAAHATAAMTGAAWAGKLEPISAYLKPDAPRQQARADAGDDDEL